MHFFHKWGPWQKGTGFRTWNGVRTGHKFDARIRECSTCLKTEVKHLYVER